MTCFILVVTVLTCSRVQMFDYALSALVSCFSMEECIKTLAFLNFRTVLVTVNTNRKSGRCIDYLQAVYRLLIILPCAPFLYFIVNCRGIGCLG